MFVDPTERARAKNDSMSADFYSQALEASKEFRKEYVIAKISLSRMRCRWSARLTGLLSTLSEKK